MTTELLLSCCYNNDHTFKSYINILNSQNGILVNIGKVDDTEIIYEI